MVSFLSVPKREPRTARLANGDWKEREPVMNGKLKNLLPFSDEEEVRIQRGIAEDADNPELTDEEMRQMRPFREVFPELAREIDKEIAARSRPER
ncbi:hypothetical protein DEV92_1011047 [Phyllobacterium myrsinacearum]|uniref:Uncharacterized protein n=2 Tax=Phyllobacterium myrsinacearum TaxID=28101 RepID=A0A2S9JZK5_9HYPH|nr:hypothetical protein C5750_06770 [Phyllobacterium myrsinacearum]PWV97054.1 hypothetical protein DEV92_1011047 [Phyllobacterium myrsinacearum]RZV08955.1 hypothetical protein EV654_0037 [Phyllobacterium myrsinacearum]